MNKCVGDDGDRRKRGRPPVLDEMKRREICAILNVGCSRQTAAKYVGCSVNTIRNTARRDAEFHTQLHKAESNLEISQLQNIQTAAKKYWQAAAWVLERKYPESYARRDPKQVTLAQVSNLLAQLADIIVEEVPVPEFRRAILKRVQRLTAGLHEAVRRGRETTGKQQRSKRQEHQPLE